MTRLSYLLKRLARLDREQIGPRTPEAELERREIINAIESMSDSTRLEML